MIRLHRSTRIVVAVAMMVMLCWQLLGSAALHSCGGMASYGWPMICRVEKWRSNIRSALGDAPKTVYEPPETNLVALCVDVAATLGIIVAVGTMTELVARRKNRCCFQSKNG